MGLSDELADKVSTSNVTNLMVEPKLYLNCLLSRCMNTTPATEVCYHVAKLQNRQISQVWSLFSLIAVSHPTSLAKRSLPTVARCLRLPHLPTKPSTSSSNDLLFAVILHSWTKYDKNLYIFLISCKNTYIAGHSFNLTSNCTRLEEALCVANQDFKAGGSIEIRNNDSLMSYVTLDVCTYCWGQFKSIFTWDCEDRTSCVWMWNFKSRRTSDGERKSKNGRETENEKSARTWVVWQRISSQSWISRIF